MAANTVAVTDILFYIAEEMGEARSEFITTVTNATTFVVRGLSLGHAVTFRSALARIDGKGTRTVSSWRDADQRLMVNSAFSPTAAVDDVLEVAWWEANKRKLALGAINLAIQLAWPYWYRETVMDRAAGGPALTAGIYSYNLGALTPAVDAVIAAGVQPATTDAIEWFPPEEVRGERGRRFRNWRLVGEPGDYRIEFFPEFSADGSIADVYSGSTLCLWYATRETAGLTEADSTRLPLEYFSVACEVYRRWQSLAPDAPAKRPSPVAMMPLEEVAKQVLMRLQMVKTPPNQIVINAQNEQVLELLAPGVKR